MKVPLHLNVPHPPTRRGLSWFAVALACLASLLWLQDFGTEGYGGRTIRIVVGFSPGGGNDLFSRIVARHIGRHLPGTPTVIVENMPGGGGLIAATYLSERAKPDGLTFGLAGASILAGIEARSETRFDPRALEFIGSSAPELPVCVFSKASGITSLERWATSKTPPRLGMTGPNSYTSLYTLTLAWALRLPIQPVLGYPGAAQIRQAMESNEVDGTCASWDGVKTSWVPLERFAIVLQLGHTPHPELQGIPLAVDQATTEQGRALIEGPVTQLVAVMRSYAFPPGTPQQHVRAMRQAFMATIGDRLFIADVGKASLNIEPLSGEEVARQVNALFATSPQLLDSLHQALKTP